MAPCSIPHVVTHNYHPARGAGRNICHLPDTEAERILDEIRASGVRRIKPNYLKRRRAVEDWLIAERSKKLGRTFLGRPVYFFLGNFADGKDLSRPESLVIPLATLRPETVTFTYGDSMSSLPIATQDQHLVRRKAYHGLVFTLAEIEAVVARFGLPMPNGREEDDLTMKHDRFIEVQVWDDRPIRKFLTNI